VRGLLLAVVAGLGLMAWWQRRRRQVEPAAAPPEDLGPDPAAELRAKLAENRDADDDEDAAEEEPSSPGRSPLDPEARRQDVHDRARASIDDLS
jgi:hypothetical protein